MMRSGNPALNDATFSQYLGSHGSCEPMTIQGTVNKTGLLLLICLISGSFLWNRFFESGQNPASIMGWMWGGVILGLITALVVSFKPTTAPIGAPLYALFEGAALGGISAIYEAQFQGIVMQAVLLTFGTLFALLLAYKSRLIQATENFKLGVTAATGGIFFLYLISIVLGLSE